MKLATWNVNSLRIRSPQVTDWLEVQVPDVLALQETKVSDELFPAELFAPLGYHSVFSGQKTYNGVALLSREPPQDVQYGIPCLEDPERRVVAATCGDVRVVCLYVPNGQAVGSDKYAYKLRWLEAAQHWLRQELAAFPRLAVMGDFNVAPEDRDVHSPARWAGQVLVSPEERRAFTALLDLGLTDTFRLFPQPERTFTWWNYGALALARNWGLRIDHILASGELAVACQGCTVDTGPRHRERPSDHAPVLAEFLTSVRDTVV